MKKVVLFMLLSLMTIGTYAQKFHVGLDYHYNFGLCERVFGKTITRSDCNLYGHSLHLTGLYDVAERMTVGLGAGLDRYEKSGGNTLPVFGTFRYKPLKNDLNAYAFTDLGFGVNSDNFVGGFLWNLGAGYTKMFRKHFGLNFQLGYNLKEFREKYASSYYYPPAEDVTYYKKSRWRHSITIGFGLVF